MQQKSHVQRRQHRILPQAPGRDGGGEGRDWDKISDYSEDQIIYMADLGISLNSNYDILLF